ncbi:hypothetical protein [uncultured Deinococcus sp.]|uniref:hypothetical protein n=1 Tax=uncultured Deinococcus sp. TaxID=158789 RepID=UPI0025E40479|nr:hypothetical protein [uncultured Deinococcus sp.]
MKCSVTSCPADADVVATRRGHRLVMLLCWVHGRAASEGFGVAIRALRRGRAVGGARGA